MRILASALVLIFAQVQCDFTPFIPGGSSGQNTGGQTTGGINGGEPAGSPIPEIGEPVSVQVISRSSVDATVRIRFLVQDYTVRETNLHVPAGVTAQPIGPDVAAFVRIEGMYAGGGPTPSMVKILGQDFQGGDTIEYIIPDPFDDCPDDPNKSEPGICGCGVPDVDTDRDGTMDCVDLCPADANKIDPGLCGCGVVEDSGDRDGDGVINCRDGCPDDASKTEPGQCGCGVPDIDRDGDGIPGCLDNNDQPVVVVVGGGGGGGGGEPPSPTCAPLADGSGCQSVSCAETGKECVPVKIRVNHQTNEVTVLACDCLDTEVDCHVAYSQSCSVYVYCLGGSTEGSTCELRLTTNEDGTIDYTCAVIKIIYVDDSAEGTNDGTSWPNAFVELQSALAVAAAGDEIRVAAGTYRPDYVNQDGGYYSNDPYASFQLVSGVKIEGGFAGNGADDPDERNIPVYETILSGEIGSPGIHQDNSNHVVDASGTDPATVLDGFTVSDGQSRGSGGGLYSMNGSATVRNCMFLRNQAYWAGGAIYCTNDALPIDGATYTNIPLSMNDNDAASDGDLVVMNCVFIGNYAQRGGAIGTETSSPTFINCTLVENASATGAGGIDNTGGSYPVLTNCILWRNRGEECVINEQTQIADDIESASRISYSCIHGLVPGGTYDSGANVANIGDDPLVVRMPDMWPGNSWYGVTYDYGDLHPQEGSPCVDTGLNNTLPALPTTDRDGSPRIMDGDLDWMETVDRGAYEYAPKAGADFNKDGDVDADDFVIFQACTTGPAIPYDPDNLPQGCELVPDDQGIIAADFDGDGDVDQEDVGVFQYCYSGADFPADPYCAN